MGGILQNLRSGIRFLAIRIQYFWFMMKRNPLHLAVKNKDIEIAKFLLDKGADTEAKDQGGNTAIFHAIDSKSLEMVKLLIERGADFEAQNTFLSTPLCHCAAYSGKV